MKIVKVRKNADGDITNVLTSAGEELDASKAVALAKVGTVESVIVGKNKNGNDVIKSSPNSTTEDNLDNLPTF
ncbi:DUF3892 domain-containing protein [Clostridium estertheticum]|uniref:DUF3892 domain-containing protein n=1 Tax=Clostridium estertheticum TaxID=238834 RepID=A0AA47EGB3_9CLOT|nr:DUF3892 domain-containing protein [Clostridium estertheticum]MBU3158135.1 DUF3892 domain-containing protein [Clostridium estertheticum]MBU3202506.1 DUF3892 domain-containing protein [Clostridium estertheticum]WAG59686.1 DUF3892 domain-containing protein [Clostridium estertheticum]WAG66242.1 DUF3892 domain-containing protein [Clostridium estertheticum]